MQDYIFCRTLSPYLPHILELPLELLSMRLIIWGYSCLTFFSWQLYMHWGCHVRVHKVPCCSSGCGWSLLLFWMSLALKHLRNRKLKDRILSTINITGHLINMEPQAEFAFNGSKIQVCYEEGLVFISLGLLPLFLCCIFMCSLESLMFEWGGFTEHLETGLWFLMPCILVNWQSMALSPSGTM